MNSLKRTLMKAVSYVNTPRSNTSRAFLSHPFMSHALIALAFAALALIMHLPMTAHAAGNKAVSYLDENGTWHSVTSYNTLTWSHTTFGGGVWVTEESTDGKAGELKLTGDTVLIITKGFRCSGIDTRGYNLTIYGDNSSGFLHVLGTSETGIGGAGTLTVCSGSIEAYTTTKNNPALGATGGIYIKGGNVVAHANDGSGNVPAIGGGKVVISGGTVKATNNVQNSPAAVIGGGQYQEGDVTITGGKVTAAMNYGVSGAAIGGAENKRGVVTISGGTVNACTKAASNRGAAIGGGKGSRNDVITITGGNVNAETSGEGDRFLVMAPAIGSGYNGYLSSVTITGGTVNAISRGCNAIGSGYMNSTYSDIKITGGNVTARDASGQCSGIGTSFASGGKLILGWSTTSDRINGGFVSGDYRSCDVSFSDGKYFWLGDTNTAATTSNLDGRTLIPSERSNICRVSFYKAGSSAAWKEESVGVGGKISDPGDPYSGVGGYHFNSWKQGSYSGEVYNFGNALTGDLNLYADHRSVITLKYGFDHEDETKYVNRGSKLPKPADPESISGLITFKGWRKQGEDHVYDFNSAVNEPFTLEAIWEYEGLRYVGGKGVTNDYRTIDRLTGTVLDSGDWVVERDITFEERLRISGTVNLILTDGYTMTASKGIFVTPGNTLNIFGQEGGTGKLSATAESSSSFAGIGGEGLGNSGIIEIYSGTVEATGGSGSTGMTGGAGIGGGYNGTGYVTIHGGNVKGSGGYSCSGIGGKNGVITITGGTVFGNGGSKSAGIGSGSSGKDSVVRISGGSVNGSAGPGCSGIGSGLWGSAKTIFFHGDGEIEVGYTGVSGVVYEGAFKLKDTETLADGNNLIGRTLVPCNAVYFSANGGSGGMSPVAKDYGDSFIIPVCSFTAPAGKTFLCWEDDDGKAYQPGQEIVVLKDVTLSARWMDIQYLSFESATDENPAGDVTKTYGDESFTNAISGANTSVTWQSSDATVAQVDPEGQVTIKNTGQAVITAVAERTSEYAEGRASYLLTVEPKTTDDPTLSVNGSYIYTGTPIIPDVTVKAGENVIPAEEYEVIPSDNVKAGVGSAAISGVAGGNYVFTNVSPVEFRIERRPVTVSGINAKNKHYDGYEDAELDFSDVLLDGKAEGDTLEVSGNAVFENAEPGEAKKVAIDIQSLTLSGKDKANYVLADDGHQQSAAATIYAPHTVRFVDEDGVTHVDGAPDQTVNNGEKAADPGVVLTKEGYRHVGWDLDGKEFDFDKPLDYETTVTLTLKPRFSKLYPVYVTALIDGGGTGSISCTGETGGAGSLSINAVEGEQVTVTATPDDASALAYFSINYIYKYKDSKQSEHEVKENIPYTIPADNKGVFSMAGFPVSVEGYDVYGCEVHVSGSFMLKTDALKGLKKAGTEHEYEVDSVADLLLLSTWMEADHDMKGETIYLTADIDLTDSQFPGFPQKISGTSNSYKFQGTFDGSGHTISGLNIDRGDDNAGLFHIVGEYATVRELKVKGTVKGGGSDGPYQRHDVGGIASVNYGIINRCTCLVNVIGDFYSNNGGIVGTNYETNGPSVNCCFYLGMGGTFGYTPLDPVGKNNGIFSIDAIPVYSVTGSRYESDGVVTIGSAAVSAEKTGYEVDGYFSKGSDVVLTLSAPDREGWTLMGFKYKKNGSGEDINLTKKGSSYVLESISQNVAILPDYAYTALKDLERDEHNYYLIKTVSDLEAVAQAVIDLEGCSGMGFRLANDIDFEGGSFSGLAVGTGDSFKGVFDGNGHVIRNMVIESDADKVGFVGYPGPNEAVKNLTLEDCRVICTSDRNTACAGMVAGDGWSAEISGCQVIGGSVIAPKAGAIIGDTSVGGSDNYYNSEVTVVSNGETLKPGYCGSPTGDVSSYSSPHTAVVAWTVRFLDGFDEAVMAVPRLVFNKETAARPVETYGLKHDHYLFNGKWQRADGSEYTFDESKEGDRIIRDTVLYSIWDEAPVFTVTMTDNDDSEAKAEISVYQDESQAGWNLPECFLRPAAGREFDKWQYNGAYYAVGEAITFSEDIAIKAFWKDAEYRIAREKMEHGTVTAEETAHYKDTVTVEVTPDKGFSLDTLSCNTLYGEAVEISDRSFTMPADDVSLSAVFTPVDYTVTAGNSGLGHGILWVNDHDAGDLSAPVTVHYGDEAAVLPDEGYVLVSCIVTDADSQPVSSSDGAFTVPDSNVTVTAVFKEAETETTECAHEHTEVRGAVQADCITKGYTGDIYCTDCGNLLKKGQSTGIDPDNHDFDEGVVTKEPTHLCDGVKSAVCRRCGKTSDSVPVPRLTDDEESNTLVEDLEQMEGKATISENVLKKEDGSTETRVTIDGKVVSDIVRDADGRTVSVDTVVWTGGLKKSYRYTGSAIKPSFHVYDGARLLKEKTDYTVSFKNNKKVGSDASVTVKFRGNYKGSAPLTVKFTIEPAVIGEDVLVYDTAFSKTGKAIKPVLDVLWTGTGKKVSAKEFLFECGTEIKDPGVYTVYVSPKEGNRNFVNLEKDNRSSLMTGAGNRMNAEAENGISVAADADDPDFTASEAAKYEACLIATESKDLLLSKASVKLDPAKYYYTGDEAAPAKGTYTLTINGSPLEEGKDYVVDRVLNNVNPGTAIMVFKAVNPGYNEISGMKTAAFKILKGRDITDDKEFVVTYEESVPYAKGGARPEVAVAYGNHKLTAGTDYTVKYSKNKAVTNGNKTAEITVSGKGYFKGKKTVYYEITKQDLSALSENILIDDKMESTKGIENPKVTATDLDGKALKAGTDFVLENYEQKQNGSNIVTVDVKGNGNYEGSVNSSYRLITQDQQMLSKAGAEKIAPRPYTGEKVTLSKDELNKLLFTGKKSAPAYMTTGTDFEVVSYTDNLNAGTAKVTVRGLGKYGGLRTLTFKITGRSVSEETSP